jgi:hypothetical protein
MAISPLCLGAGRERQIQIAPCERCHIVLEPRRHGFLLLKYLLADLLRLRIARCTRPFDENLVYIVNHGPSFIRDMATLSSNGYARRASPAIGRNGSAMAACVPHAKSRRMRKRIGGETKQG